ncbi:MAG TPA: helix-turn-helix domain-containing protein [Thermoplasmata archaeon]|nr:helix-turn-helix domain-containing protein [Thermoplasmata archaeon]
MQAVTLEFATADLESIGVVPREVFRRVEEVELLETLRLEHGWRLQLLRVRRRGALRTAGELERDTRRIRREYGLESFELVERRPRTRDYILLVRQRNAPTLRRLLDVAGGGVTPAAPFLLTPERVVASLRGEERSVRRVLRRLKTEGLPFRVVRTTPRPYAVAREPRTLSPRQETALARAWTLGYYAVPRRITLTRLARVIGVSPPAVGKLLRRAEGHLVARFLAGSPPVA